MVLNNQPQGGLAMRKRLDDDRVADRNGWDGGFFGFGGAIRTPSTPLRANAAARTIISGSGEDAARRVAGRLHGAGSRVRIGDRGNQSLKGAPGK